MSSKYCCTRTDCVYHPHKGPDKGTCDYMVITRKRRGGEKSQKETGECYGDPSAGIPDPEETDQKRE